MVVESFYKKDNTVLKRHTTSESYESFLSIQYLMVANENGSSNFTVIRDSVIGNTSWVKFSTSYEDLPKTFKLALTNDKWMVTEKGLREKAPF